MDMTTSCNHVNGFYNNIINDTKMFRMTDYFEYYSERVNKK